jgi:flagellar protein FlaG
MNIQPLGLPATPRIDDRPAQAGQPSVAAVPAAAGAANAAAPTREQVLAAVKQINQSLPASSQTLEFSLDDDSKQMVIKVVDQDTKEVVRQIPSVEALEIAKSLDKMMGLLIRQKA